MSIETIVVDVTPILPGGENGGAKIFVLELVSLLAQLHPQTNFVLLTQSASHNELAALDGDNVRRIQVVGDAVGSGPQPDINKVGEHVVSRIPSVIRSAVARFAYPVNRFLMRLGKRSMLHDLGADLLFCPFTAPTFSTKKVPTVCTIYDLQFKEYPMFFSAVDRAHRKKTFRDACRRAIAMAAISDYSKDAAISYGKLPQEKVRTIYLRMAQRIALSPENSGVNTSCDFGAGISRHILYPANFWQHKNHEMLLTAFGMACAQGLPEDIGLVLTGAPGERQDWLIQAAKGLNLQDRVLLPGYLADRDLAYLMTNATGVVFPSLYEGFGLPVVEAMAAGVPVACSNSTSLSEVVGDAAILYNPKVPTEICDALLTLVSDQPIREQCISAGKLRAVEFSNSKRMAVEYWDLFEFAIANHSRTSRTKRLAT